MDIRINQLPKKIDHDLRNAINDTLGDVFPAVTLAVIHRGEVVFNDGWGWVDPETKAHAVTPDKLFDLASVTKLFTATAFLSLVSAGAVRLDDPLVSVVPEFGAGGLRDIDGGQDPHSKERLPTPAQWVGAKADPARVTFGHLLTHTSGLAPWRDVYNAPGVPPTPPDQPDPIPQSERWARGLKAICGYAFVGQPDGVERGAPKGVVRYSDLGLMLLGEAVSRLQGAPLEEAIKARVLKPLGLQSPTFNPVRNGLPRTETIPTEDDPGWRKRRPWGEVHDENACGVGGVAGHAGLFANALDVAQFGEVWRTHDARLNINPALMDEATREHAETDGERRGLGWMLKSHVGSSAGDRFSPASYGHTGFTGTSLWIEPEQQLVVALLTNRVYPGRWKEGIHEFRRAVHHALSEYN
jgi:CubicO group peptidase (beta-lactamase class C family)